MPAELTAARVRELFDYQQDTGLLIYRIKSGKKMPGDVAGTLNGAGYIQVGIDYKLYLAHRIIWLWMTGEWPDPECDHEDTNRANNRWGNLREATSSQNKCNKSPQSNNKSGYRGVSWNAKLKRWCAFIQIARKTKYLGSFTDKEKAFLAYCAAAEENHKQFARPHRPQPPAEA
jgi:hypothetical protein